MATVKPFYPLVANPDNPGHRIRSSKPVTDTYLLRWKNHKDKWQSKIFHGTRISAEKLLNKIVAEVDEILAGLKAPPEKTIRLSDAFEGYIKHLESINRSPATIYRYRYSFIAFRKFFSKDSKLHQITRKDIERFRLERAKECTNTGINIDLRHLKAFFSWCYGMEYVNRSPFVGIKIETAGKPVRFLSSDEIRALYDVLEDEPVTKDLISFYLLSGARAKEILHPRFTWSNVNQDEITLIGKRNKIRHVSLNDTMKGILESRMHLKHPFPYKYDFVYDRIVRIAYDKAGILDADVHTLRKTAGALLIQAGVDIYRVSKFLGHGSVTVTEKHYVDLLKQDYQDISAILESQIKSDTQMIRTEDTKSDQKSVRIRAYQKDSITRIPTVVDSTPGRNRTPNQWIKSPLLYRLSYWRKCLYVCSFPPVTFHCSTPDDCREATGAF